MNGLLWSSVVVGLVFFPMASAQPTQSSGPCNAAMSGRTPATSFNSFQRFDAELRSAVARQDPAALAFLVAFPLRVNMQKGTILIPDSESLAGHFQEIFPAAIREQILATKNGEYICRDEGIGYRTGVIWVAESERGYALTVVNGVDTKGVSKEPRLVFTCETPTHRIAIDELADGKVRYRSWDKPKPLTGTPDIEVANGKQDFEGHGVCAYATYTFAKGNVVYEVEGASACGESNAKDNGSLSVTVNGKQVTSVACDRHDASDSR